MAQYNGSLIAPGRPVVDPGINFGVFVPSIFGPTACKLCPLGFQSRVRGGAVPHSHSEVQRGLARELSGFSVDDTHCLPDIFCLRGDQQHQAPQERQVLSQLWIVTVLERSLGI